LDFFAGAALLEAALVGAALVLAADGFDGFFWSRFDNFAP
jgi:hypothetical protein